MERYKLRLFFILYLGVQIGRLKNIEKNDNVIEIDDKPQFNASVTTINGQIYVKWNTKDTFQSKVVNISVYLLTNIAKDDNSLNNIQICQVFYNDSKWNIAANHGNLLHFCKEHNLCGVFADNITNLVGSFQSNEEIGCSLFTTCSNFTQNYTIQISTTFVDNNTRQDYHFRNMNIYKQNQLPVASNIYLTEVINNTGLIQWSYPQLCNFQSNFSENLQFILNYYQVNSNNQCSFLSQIVRPFETRSMTINFPQSKTNQYVMYLSMKSLITNKTDIFWQKQVSLKNPDTSQTCQAYNGTMKISWKMNQQCVNISVVKRILFCATEQPSCIPVCELTQHQNYSVTNETYSENIVEFCEQTASSCLLTSKTTHLVHSFWEPSKNLFHCHIFKPCINYISTFSIKGQTFLSSRLIEEEQFCGGDVNIVSINQPPPPVNVTAVNIGQTDVLLSWHFDSCPTLLVSFQILLNNEKVNTKEIHSSEKKHVYTQTIRGLRQFANYKVEIRAINVVASQVFSTSKTTIFTTKEAAPIYGPRIIQNEWQENDIKLSWQLPPASKLLGIPTHFVIAISNINNVFIWNTTLFGRNITSTVIDGKYIPDCQAMKINISICVAKDLCSKPTETTTSKPLCNHDDSVRETSTLGATEIAMISVAAVFIIFIILFLPVWHKRKKSVLRQRLPSLSGLPLSAESDYSNVGLPNEYDSL